MASVCIVVGEKGGVGYMGTAERLANPLGRPGEARCVFAMGQC